jgi:hypothetical protein
MREHRKAPRKRVKEWAKLILDERRCCILCTIVDISDTGARLAVRDAELPAAFFVFLKSDKSLREAVVIRREQQFLGVRLAPPLDLASEKAKSLLSLVANP